MLPVILFHAGFEAFGGGFDLSSHKAPAVREMIEAAGASLLYLPPYSPDFNPIERAFSKLKTHLRKAAEPTIHCLWNAIGRILDLGASKNPLAKGGLI